MSARRPYKFGMKLPDVTWLKSQSNNLIDSHTIITTTLSVDGLRSHLNLRVYEVIFLSVIDWDKIVVFLYFLIGNALDNGSVERKITAIKIFYFLRAISHFLTNQTNFLSQATHPFCSKFVLFLTRNGLFYSICVGAVYCCLCMLSISSESQHYLSLDIMVQRYEYLIKHHS